MENKNIKIILNLNEEWKKENNVMEGYPEITKDNWNGGIQIESQPNTAGYTENMRSYEPFAMPYIKITSAGISNQIIVTNGSIRGMKGKISYFCLLK
mgnify:CR=1 FL=1